MGYVGIQNVMLPPPDSERDTGGIPTESGGGSRQDEIRSHCPTVCMWWGVSALCQTPTQAMLASKYRPTRHIVVNGRCYYYDLPVVT